MITLVAIICRGILCQDVIVPTDTMVAGKTSDPIPMEYTEIMCRTHGFQDAEDWLTIPDSPQYQQYKDWRITGIMCVHGKYESGKRA